MFELLAIFIAGIIFILSVRLSVFLWSLGVFGFFAGMVVPFINIGFWVIVAYVTALPEIRKMKEVKDKYVFCNQPNCPNCGKENPHGVGTVRYRPDLPNEVNVTKICYSCKFEY